MFRKLILYLFLLLSAIGLTYDTQSYTSGALSGSAYGIIGLSTLIALCYIVPGLGNCPSFFKEFLLPL